MKIQKPLRGKPALYKRRKSMEILGCSLSTIKKLEEAGKLEKVRLLTRDVYHRGPQVDALAAGGEDGEDES